MTDGVWLSLRCDGLHASDTTFQPVATVSALPQAKTDKSGEFSVKKLNAEATFFPFVALDAKDTEHLPGGDLSRFAFTPKSLKKGTLKIQISWKAPEDAQYIGTTACFVCHGPGSNSDVTSHKKHGHALAFQHPGQDTANQNSAAHVGADRNALARKFTLATQPDPKLAPVPTAPATSITYLNFQDYNTTAPYYVVYENSKGTTAIHFSAVSLEIGRRALQNHDGKRDQAHGSEQLRHL